MVAANVELSNAVKCPCQTMKCIVWDKLIKTGVLCKLTDQHEYQFLFLFFIFYLYTIYWCGWHTQDEIVPQGVSKHIKYIYRASHMQR